MTNVRITQASLEALREGDPKVRVTQTAVEVLRKSSAYFNAARVTLAAIEVLRDAALKYTYEVFPYTVSMGIKHTLIRQIITNELGDGFIYEESSETPTGDRADGNEGLQTYCGINKFSVTFNRTLVGTDQMADLLWEFFITHLDNINEPFYFYNPTEYYPPDLTGATKIGRYTVKLANPNITLTRKYFGLCLYSYGFDLIEHRDFDN